MGNAILVSNYIFTLSVLFDQGEKSEKGGERCKVKVKKFKKYLEACLRR